MTKKTSKLQDHSKIEEVSVNMNVEDNSSRMQKLFIKMEELNKKIIEINKELNKNEQKLKK